MTPLITFQWPLSPSGTFQLEKSFPLKSDTKPAGGSLSAAFNSKGASTKPVIANDNEKTLANMANIEVFMASDFDLSLSPRATFPFAIYLQRIYFPTVVKPMKRKFFYGLLLTALALNLFVGAQVYLQSVGAAEKEDPY